MSAKGYERGEEVTTKNATGIGDYPNPDDPMPHGPWDPVIRAAIERALSNCEAGIDFADALHHASYKSCDSVATFDDRKFARRAKKLGLTPAVVLVS